MTLGHNLLDKLDGGYKPTIKPLSILESGFFFISVVEFSNLRYILIRGCFLEHT